MTLLKDGRHDEAAGVLRAVAPGGVPLDVADPDAVKLRMFCASVLADNSDIRAAGEFLRLGDDLAAPFGVEDERVVQCRVGEADC
ncbi:hypothetical protein ABZ914_24485 [Spirillospora sp. NPDC046719]